MGAGRREGGRVEITAQRRRLLRREGLIRLDRRPAGQEAEEFILPRCKPRRPVAV